MDKRSPIRKFFTVYDTDKGSILCNFGQLLVFCSYSAE